MCRLSGFETIANEVGHDAYFITLTCPSRMHSSLSKHRKRNPRYDSTNPKEAQKYLNGVWQKTRAKWKRQGINPYWMRVAEPQHDGTPHWHLLLFVIYRDANAALSILEDYALRDSPSERRAKEHRVTVKAIDPEKGTATGYIAKYISKNIDGEYLESDVSGMDATEASYRVTTWAKTWGIRQFQQFGGPPVSIWRQLRKIQPDSCSGILKEAAQCADIGDWCGFTKVLGGIAVPRGELPIQLAKAWSDKQGNYGDPIGDIIYGLKAGDEIVATKDRDWTIQPKSTEGALEFCQ